MNTSPRELHRPTDAETQSAMEVIRRDFAADYHKRREAEIAHAREQIEQLEAYARGCLSRIKPYREMAADYTPGSPRNQHYLALAAGQWSKAKDAMRRAYLERMKL